MAVLLDLDTLNPEQREAVEWPGGPLLIFAGAGSGKTRVITQRIARLIKEGTPPSRILAVTFTNKAAREMRERVAALVGDSAASMWIGTFHSLCARILRIDGKAIGLDPNFVIYDDGDQLSLIREIFKAKNIDDKSIQPRGVLNEISSAKEKLLTPEKYSDKATGFFERIVADVYRSYNALLNKANALDFDDILFYAVRLFEQRKDVLEKYQERFLHVLVDEYQDVNYAQYQIVHLVSEKHRNIVVVGDDDQSIYAWRGADVSLILRFGSDHPDAKIVKLERNYRSTKNILAAANAVIQKNRSRASKQLWTDNEEGAAITLTQAGTEQDEAMLVADAILKDVRTGRRKYGDFAVLYRTNAQSRVVEEAFLTMRIPHMLVGGVRFYERKEIKDMLSYLRLTLNPRDDIAVRRVINLPTRGIGAGAMSMIEQWANDRGLPLFNALAEQEVQSSLQKKTASGVRAFVGAINDATELAEQGPVTPVLRSLLSGSGYVDMLKEDRSDDSLSRLENLQELLNVTSEYDASSDSPSLSGFLESVSLVADVDNLNEGGDAVTLMTLHSAKGLEFPIVYMVGLEEGVFPHARSLNSDSELEEERRLCYVGMTRAREELNLVYAHRRSLYGQPNFNRRSRFLDDLPNEIIDTISHSGYAMPAERRSVYQERTGSYSQPPSSLFAEPHKEKISPTYKPPFEIGQRVRHAKFGIGVVVACNPIKNDSEVTVAFPGVTGVKKLAQSFAKLEAV
ncbi:MAG: ATP-dependent DNA helicase PcrA [Armatimonadetes bacterium 55-13]|nr:DNA helicase PcrA [Armatimonadota bacterium]OJU64394.1 MAG: ATP-dependent DNA helicase PcrA [Armatimonadetes bacterium 55-13]